VSHSPFAEVRRTVSQENARLTNECGASCTAEDFQRIDQQMAALEQAGNLAEIAQRGGMTTPQAQQMAQLLLELAPVYGSGESLLQLITGQSSLTGEEASRVWAAIGIIPVAGGVLKKVGEPAVDALNAIFKGGDAAKSLVNAFADFNQAQNAAVHWLEARGFKAEQATFGKFGDNAGTPIGMKSADGKSGFRVEYDDRHGAHINVWSGKPLVLGTLRIGCGDGCAGERGQCQAKKGFEHGLGLAGVTQDREYPGRHCPSNSDLGHIAREAKPAQLPSASSSCSARTGL